MIEIGRYEDAEIIEHRLSSTPGGTMFVSLTMQVEQDRISCTIWLSNKAWKMAKRSLKICGFDIDKRNLEELHDNPRLLAGRRVPIEVDDNDYNGRVTRRAQIALTGKVDRTKLKAIQDRMRNGAEVGKDEITNDDIPF